MDKKRTQSKEIWGLLFVLIAILSIYSISIFNKDFSFNKFLEFINTSSVIWIALSFLAVFLYIYLEGRAITTICKNFGYNKKRGFVYSAADLYFSAITPSATGGQPASAYFMYKDNIPVPIITLTLLYNLFMYVVAFFTTGVLVILLKPSIFLSFSTIAKLLIVFGFIFQFGFIILFYCLLYKDRLLNTICRFFLNILVKLHLVKNKQEKLDKLCEVTNKYQEAAKMIKGKKKVIFKVFIYNLLQRFAQISVLLFVYLGSGGDLSNLLPLAIIQVLVSIACYCVPIPGAMGVTDHLLLSGFKTLMGVDAAINLELLSRGISFYLCIGICGLTILIRYILIKRS